MIGHIQGEVLFSDGVEVIISTNSGIGYQITFHKVLAEGQFASLFISHVIREAAQTLYGFEGLRDKKLFAAAMNELSLITGRKPAYSVAKNSISNFKIREGQKIGLFVTLRGEIMYEFLERLVYLVLPRVHNFRGFSSKSFDNCFNFSFGIKDCLVFNELSYDKVAKSRGLNVSFDIRAFSKVEAIELLRGFKLPIRD